MEIRQILDKVDENQIFVPAFQREYVWTRNNAKALFHSLIRRYPTGTLLTWETNKPPELKGPIGFKSEMGSVKLILDGQQRVTTLYLILRGKIPPYYSQKEITQNVQNLYVNIKNLELEYYKPSIMANDPAWINLTEIFKKEVRPNKIIKQIATSPDEEDLLFDNFHAINVIPDRNFPEQIIPPGASVKEAIDIFYIVNASGVNLTDAELALAQISGYWPKAREKFKEKLFALKERGFVFKLDFIVYCLLAVLHNKGSEMERLHSKSNDGEIQKAWERLDSKVLDYVLNMMKTNAYIDHTDEINSVYALIPIISYVYKKKEAKLTEEEIKKAIKWFYYSQVWQRFSGQLQQKLDRDLGIINDHSSPFDALLDQILLDRRSLEITPDDFVGRGVGHPLFSLMRWYFKSKNAVCFGTGIGLRRNMGEKYKLENDHIFPYSALRDNGYPVNNRFKYAMAQEITNRAILTQTENRSKSATAAFDYLTKVQENNPGALEKQCIPLDESLWAFDRFEDFLNARREILANELNAYLEGITLSKEKESEISLEDIISQGEHDRLEFKQTLRWDIEQSTVNKILEAVILKTISAFSNADGGTLMIGVDKDCNPVGLEDDYATLKDGTKDGFELHLRNLITRQWGEAFAANNVKISFPSVNGCEVCEIKIQPGNEPLYLDYPGKEGQKMRKFFVRSGNSSPPMDDPVEIAKHFAKRFPHLAK